MEGIARVAQLPGRSSLWHRLCAALSLIVLLSSGCATTSGVRNPQDPFEPYNRAMFEFNDALDTMILEPLARGYEFAIPEIVREGVTNFFENLLDVGNAINNLLQGKPEDAASDLGRLMWNTSVGLLGLIDVASKLGFEKHEEDFGQTLGVWGVGPGPFFMLPLLGPSTVRDAPSLIVDLLMSPLFYYEDETVRWTLRGLEIIDIRAGLFKTEEVVDEVAYDRYQFIRDAFLQRREYLVRDGEVPDEGDDLLKELEDLEEFEAEEALREEEEVEEPRP